jgi:DNA-binding transcriptional MerR regulator
VRRIQHGAELAVADVAEHTPRRDADIPQRLRLPEVADPGDEPLVEERVADLTLPRLGAKALDHRIEVGRRVEDVRAEMRDAGAVTAQLKHGPVPEDALVRLAPQHEPRLPDAARAALLDAPAPGHPQVALEHQPALEPKEEVLPDGLHALEHAPVEPVREVLRRSPGMRRFDLQALPHEHLQPLRGPPQGITLWHNGSLVGHSLARRMTAGLNIAALSRRTGVAPDTLRKWEQRYQILRPSRTSGGQRRYDERDVARVEWLCERLQEGYRISEAATLLGTTDVAPTRGPREHLRAVLKAVDSGEASSVGLLVDQAFALYGVDVTLDEILNPLLQEIGDRWAAGKLTVAEEHLVSEAVRSRLGHLLADAGGGVHGSAVLACAPGEQHELGLMMLAIALRRDGWKVIYLGADTPFDAAVALAERVSARLVGISLTTPEHAAAFGRNGSVQRGIEVVLGGKGATPALAKRIGATHAGGPIAECVAALRVFAA